MHEHALCTAPAALTEARGELDQAAELYYESAGRWERFGALPERGHALMGDGALPARARGPGARASLVEARDIFAGLGALRLLSHVDELFARSIAVSQPRGQACSSLADYGAVARGAEWRRRRSNGSMHHVNDVLVGRGVARAVRSPAG
jgi:hypothetical protein